MIPREDPLLIREMHHPGKRNIVFTKARSELLFLRLNSFLLNILKSEMGCISCFFSYQKLGISSKLFILVLSKMHLLGRWYKSLSGDAYPFVPKSEP